MFGFLTLKYWKSINKFFFTNNKGKNGRSHMKNRMREMQKDFGAKYGNGKIIKKAEWINNMETELRMFKEIPKGKIHPDTLKATL